MLLMPFINLREEEIQLMQVPRVDFRSSANINRPSCARQDAGGRAVSIRRCICDISGSYRKGTNKSEFYQISKWRHHATTVLQGPYAGRFKSSKAPQQSKFLKRLLFQI